MNIHIPTPLRAYTDGKETVAIPGATISAVFTQLTTTYPELRQHLCVGVSVRTGLVKAARGRAGSASERARADP